MQRVLPIRHVAQLALCSALASGLLVGCGDDDSFVPNLDGSMMSGETSCLDDDDAIYGVEASADDLDEVVTLGARWVRVRVTGEGTRGIVERFHERGVRVMLEVGPAILAASTPGRFATRADWEPVRGDYLDQLERVADDVGSLADAWEIWGEPNVEGASHVPPREFGLLLRDALDVVGARSGAPIIVGTLIHRDVGAGECEPASCDRDQDGARFLSEALSAVGGKLPYDGVGVWPEEAAARPDIESALDDFDDVRRDGAYLGGLPIWLRGTPGEGALSASRVTGYRDVASNGRWRVTRVFLASVSPSGTLPGLVESGARSAAYDATASDYPTPRPTCSGAGEGRGDPADALCAPSGVCYVEGSCSARVGACRGDEICRGDGWWADDPLCNADPSDDPEVCASSGVCFVAAGCLAEVDACHDGLRCASSGLFVVDDACGAPCDPEGVCSLSGARCDLPIGACDADGSECQADGSWEPTVMCGGLEPPAELEIVVNATGSPAMGVYPHGQILVDDVAVYEFDVDAEYRSYTYTHPTVVEIRRVKVAFTNDGGGGGEDRNMFVDWVTFNGERYESEAPTTYSEGVYDSETACGPGFKTAEVLACNGFFQYET